MLCVISNGPHFVTTMTKASFARSCLAHQGNTITQCGPGRKYRKVAKKEACRDCSMGAKVMNGEPLRPPKGIKFLAALETTLPQTKLQDKEEKKMVEETAQSYESEIISIPADRIETVAPADLTKLWLSPQIKGKKRSTCPCCKRENHVLASYGVCGRCRRYLVGKIGNDLIAAIIVASKAKNLSSGGSKRGKIKAMTPSGHTTKSCAECRKEPCVCGARKAEAPALVKRPPGNEKAPNGHNFDAITRILDELRKTETKHPVWPTDQIHAVGILIEEAGESMQAAIDCHYAGGSLEKLRTELAQTGAMALRALINLPTANG